MLSIPRPLLQYHRILILCFAPIIIFYFIIFCLSPQGSKFHESCNIILFFIAFPVPNTVPGNNTDATDNNEWILAFSYLLFSCLFLGLLSWKLQPLIAFIPCIVSTSFILSENSHTIPAIPCNSPPSLKESEVAQSCPTLCDPMDCSLSGSSVHGIFQAIVLELGAISFSRGSS